jgi:hypothetical protein
MRIEGEGRGERCFGAEKPTAFFFVLLSFVLPFFVVETGETGEDCTMTVASFESVALTLRKRIAQSALSKNLVFQGSLLSSPPSGRKPSPAVERARR